MNQVGIAKESHRYRFLLLVPLASVICKQKYPVALEYAPRLIQPAFTCFGFSCERVLVTAQDIWCLSRGWSCDGIGNQPLDPVKLQKCLIPSW